MKSQYWLLGVCLTLPLAFTTPINANTLCDSAESIDLPFSIDGADEVCYVTSGDISYVNSWNVDSVTINDVDYTGSYSDSMPDAIDGQYYIYYSGAYAWSHLDVMGESTETAESEETTDEESTEVDSYELTISVSGYGSTSPIMGTYDYEDGEVVEVEAIPDDGYEFTGWSGALTSSNTTISITISSDLTLVASFEAIEVTEEEGSEETTDEETADSTDSSESTESSDCGDYCNSATPVYPTIFEDGGTGNVTVYSTSASSGGACNYGDTDVMYYAAINVHSEPGDYAGQWDGGAICGQCAKITTQTSEGEKTVVARIMDKCPDAYCGIDTGGDAPALLMPDGSGRYDGEWEFVSCDGYDDVFDGDPELHVFAGSNAWWSRIHVRNGLESVSSIAWEIDDETGEFDFAEDPENFFEVPTDILQMGADEINITINYRSGDTATVTVSSDDLGTSDGSYTLD